MNQLLNDLEGTLILSLPADQISLGYEEVAEPVGTDPQVPLPITVTRILVRQFRMR